MNTFIRFILPCVASSCIVSAHAVDPDDLKSLLETRVCEECDLLEADLKHANLGGARLARAMLADAELAQAENLSAKQLEAACGDAETTLPDGLTVRSCR